MPLSLKTHKLHVDPDITVTPPIIGAGNFYRPFLGDKKLFLPCQTGFIKPVINIPIHFGSIWCCLAD
jgi:hypothetical protein